MKGSPIAPNFISKMQVFFILPNYIIMSIIHKMLGTREDNILEDACNKVHLHH